MVCHCPLRSVLSDGERLIFLARGFAVMCYFVFVACLWYFFRQRSTFKGFLENVVVAHQWLMKMLRQRWVADPDAHARKVRDVMKQMNENRCGLLLQVIVGWCCLNILSHIVRVHLASVWSDDIDLDRIRPRLLDGLAIKEVLIAALVVMSPFSSATDTANVVHVVLVVCSICFQWLHSDLAQYTQAVQGNTTSHILLAVFLGRPGDVVLLNTLFWGFTWIRGLSSDGFPSYVSVMGTVVAPFLAAILSKKLMESEARAIVAAMNSESSETAVKDLLNIMCDAVVVLDEQLFMVSPSPRLDALLFKQRNPQSAGEERPFPSLFHGTDQDRVSQFLAEHHSSAQSAKVTLRDAFGLNLGAHLFHRRFEDVLGQTRHVIGVVEDTDLAHQEPPADSEPLLFSTSLPLDYRSSHERPEASGVDGSSTGGSSSSGRSSDFVPLRVPSQDDSLEIQIDTTSEELRILSYTASATSVLGPVEGGTSLLDMVVRRDKERFLRWVMDGGTAPTRVTLRDTIIASLKHSATCVLLDADVPSARCLVLSDLKKKSGGRSTLQRAQGTERQARTHLRL